MSAIGGPVGAGEGIRRAMFGDELVDRNYVNASEFDRPMQEWLMHAVWDGVWTREELTRRERSLITLGILAALGRPDELEMHVRAAGVNGCSQTDIREALLQVAPYAGAPAALSAFRVAGRVLDRSNPSGGTTDAAGSDDA